MLSARPRRTTAALLALALLASTSSASTDPAPDPVPGTGPAAIDPWKPVMLPVAAREYPIATAGRRQGTPGAWSTPEQRGMRWRKGQAVLQGWLGFTDYSSIRRTGGSGPPVEGQGIQNMPAIGGGAQWKMNSGDRVDLGLEALIDFSGRANGGAFWFGGGGSGVAISVDMWVVELLGGAVVSKFVGKTARVYAGAGPVMQWVSYSQDGPLAQSSSGFGTGFYGRFGFEWAATPSSLVGLGARYSETSVGLGSGLGDLEIEGWRYMFTITRGF